jgi:hypothetical protein
MLWTCISECIHSLPNREIVYKHIFLFLFLPSSSSLPLPPSLFLHTSSILLYLSPMHTHTQNERKFPPPYSFYPLTSQNQTQVRPQTQCLLLIFHRNPHANNPYTLINPPGLPISNASPFLHAGAARVPETKADLLATVTEVVAGGEGGLGE